jgi:hypothetical protein
MADKYVVTVEKVTESGSGIFGLFLLAALIYWGLGELGIVDPVVADEPVKIEHTAIDINAMEEGPAKNLAKNFLDLKPCSQVPKYNDSEVTCLKD